MPTFYLRPWRRQMARMVVAATALSPIPSLANSLRWDLIENTCPNGVTSSVAECIRTERLKVPDGWLVRSIRFDRMAQSVVGPSDDRGWVSGAAVGVGLTFLPDPNYTWTP
jgi:hypothetical protein